VKRLTFFTLILSLSFAVAFTAHAVFSPIALLLLLPRKKSEHKPMQTVIESSNRISFIGENKKEGVAAGNSFFLKLIKAGAKFFSGSANSKKTAPTIKMVFHESTNFRWDNEHGLLDEW
jgi:hypothetical protein